MPAAAGLLQRQNLRLRIIGVVALSLLAALFARLWYLQVLEREELRAAASANIVRVVHEEAPRGRIFDANGRILVDNEVVYVVVIDRRELAASLGEDAQERMFTELAQIVSRSGRLTKALDIASRLASREYGAFDTVPVAIDIDPDLLVYLGERRNLFPGVSVEERTVRSYPYGVLAAHVLGYVGPMTASEYRAKTAQIDPSEPGAKTYQPGDEIGKSGVERIFEDQLRGTPGRRVFEVNAFNEIVAELDELGRAPVPGNDVHMTIDIDIQRLVESELRRALDRARDQPQPEGQPDAPEFTASAGAAVALDPRDGSVLAMVSFPTYDPRDFVGGISQRLFDDLTSADNLSPILNRAIQGEYAPGSTFKLITSYAALTQGVVADGDGALIGVEEFYTDTGTYRYPICLEDSDTCVFRSPYCCQRGVDLRDAITVSSDTYFYRIAGEGFFQRSAPADEGIQVAARLFGLGRATGVTLPYERGGVVPDRAYYDYQYDQGVFLRGGDNWYAGDTINLSIGQGNLLTTPIQMANAYAAVAGGGHIYQPNMARRITDRDGNTLEEFGPRPVSFVDIPAHVAEPLLDGLNGVTAYNLPGSSGADDLLVGTAYHAFNLPEQGGVVFPLDDWPVAGKTGTAEKIGQADNAWFIGFGPAPWPERDFAHTPEIVVAMVLEEAGFGGVVAAPAVARILLPVATDTVERARTAEEVDSCYAEVKVLTSFLEGVRVGEIKVDADGEPISVERPPLSEECSQLVGGEQAVEKLGLDALL